MTSPALPAKPRSLRRGLVRLLSLVAMVFGGLIVMFAALQRTLMYAPARTILSFEEAGLNPDHIRNITVTAPDGITLHGWLASKEPGTTAPSTRRLVILFPGNGGNRSYRGSILNSFNTLGWDVLICDYRGYGENEGSPSETAFADDARAIWKSAREQLGYPAENIVLCGESLGGGVATRLAFDLQQQGIVPGGLILRTTFTSMTDTAAWHYPWLPVRTILLDRYSSIDRIGQLQCPILVIHGEQDSIVPFAQGQALFAAAPAQSAKGVPKKFLPLPGANHNDVEYIAARELHEAHREFLASVVGDKR